MTGNLTALIALIALFVIPPAMAADNPHCVTAKTGFGETVTTQCDDGTVTVTTHRKMVVCRKSLNGGHDCTEIKL